VKEVVNIESGKKSLFGGNQAHLEARHDDEKNYLDAGIGGESGATRMEFRMRGRSRSLSSLRGIFL